MLIGWDPVGTGSDLKFSSGASQSLEFDSGSRLGTMTDLDDALNSVGTYNHPLETITVDPTLTRTEDTGSVRDYYRAISHNRLDIQFEILPANNNGVTTNPTSQTIDDFAYLVMMIIRIVAPVK